MPNPEKVPSPKSLPSRFSSLLFWAGAITGGYGLVRTWFLYRDLPPGVCPFDRYRPLTYVALGLLAVSIALDLLSSLRARRKNIQSE